MNDDKPPITIDSMFAADPGLAERMEARRRETRELVEKALAPQSDEERAVLEFLRDTLGYDPPIAYGVE